MTHTDFELLQQLKSGDEQAFLAFYRRLRSPVYAFVMHMSGSHTLAEDITQEVFLVLMRRPMRYDSSRGTVAGYLLGIARNCLLQQLKRNREHFVLVPDTHTVAETRRVEGDPLSDLLKKEKVQNVREAVLKLPVHYREVLVLCELEEKSYQEAAAILDCSDGTVRSRLYRARALLLQKLRMSDKSLDFSGARSRRCMA